MTTTARRIKTETRRLRKRQLAYFFGGRCAYCRCRLGKLRDATLDHIVPNHLWPTGTLSALVLACFDCNHRKADRFPLSIALLLLRSMDPGRPVVRPADLPTLARLAAACQTAPTRVTTPLTPRESVDRSGDRSTRPLPEPAPTDATTPERTAA